MQKITFTNSRGKSVSFGYSLPFLLSSIEGIGGVAGESQTQKSPFQDGTTYIDTNLESRFIPITFEIKGKNYTEVSQLRRYLSSVFNPKLGLGTLEYRVGDLTREIKTYCESAPIFPSGDARGMNYQMGMIDLTAPNPYWRSPNETTKPLVAYEGGFTLPFTLPFTLGRSGSKTVLYNDGDVPAPMRIEIHGPTTNPQIFNRTTGEHIRINRTVAEGEVMRINTESGRQRITVTDENGNESNAFGYLDSESSILSQFNLELGENEIEHVADAGNRHAEVIVRWDDLYVGV